MGIGVSEISPATGHGAQIRRVFKNFRKRHLARGADHVGRALIRARDLAAFGCDLRGHVADIGFGRIDFDVDDGLEHDRRRLGERVGRLDQHFRQTQKDVEEITVSTAKLVRRGERIEQVEVGELATEAAQAPVLSLAE